jgi:hypothetical protein
MIQHAFRMSPDAANYAQNLTNIRAIFLESLSRKKMRNRKRKSAVKAEDLLYSDAFGVTDNAFSSDSCYDSSVEDEEAATATPPIVHTLSFPDFDSLGVSAEARAEGFAPSSMPLSIEDELLLDNGCDFDWIDELADNM